MVENKTIKDRLILFLKRENLSQSKFEKICGLSNGYVNSVKNSITLSTIGKITDKFPNLNLRWLRTGEGEMLNISDEVSREEHEVLQSAGPSLLEQGVRMVPVLNLDSVGVPESNNSMSLSEGRVVDYVPLRTQEGVICIQQSGESMLPRIPPGTLLAIRKVLSWYNFIGYGNVFVLVLKDKRRLTKVIKPGSTPETLTLESFNPEYPPEEIARECVSEIWKVVIYLNNLGW